MWLGLRYAVDVKLPDLAHVLNELGTTEDAIRYRQLLVKYPKVKIGPDEDMAHHYTRLKSAEDTFLNKGGIPEELTERRAQDPRAQAYEDPDARQPGWVTLREKEQSALPRREPGRDLAESPPPPMRGRDLPQRVPAPIPTHLPPQQSIQDWVQDMRNRGITLNHALERPNAARPEDMVGPAQGWGRQHIKEFTNPSTEQPYDASDANEIEDRGLKYLPQGKGGLGRSWRDRAADLFGRRKASTIVTDYIEGILR